MTEKCYILNLSGPGDHYLVIVDQVAWDWIMSNDPGLPPGKTMGIGRGQLSSWEDRLVPDSLKERIEESGGTVELTSGSWQNDRALCMIDAGLECCDSIKEAMDWIKGHDMELVDDWEGCVY